MCRMYPDGGTDSVGNTFMCSAGTGPSISLHQNGSVRPCRGRAMPVPAATARKTHRFPAQIDRFGTHKCVPYTARTSVGAFPELPMRHGPGMAAAPTGCGVFSECALIFRCICFYKSQFDKKMRVRCRFFGRQRTRFVCYSVRRAVTGSFFAAFLAGIRPPSRVSRTLRTIRMIAPGRGRRALTMSLSMSR